MCASLANPFETESAPEAANPAKMLRLEMCFRCVILLPLLSLCVHHLLPNCGNPNRLSFLIGCGHPLWLSRFSQLLGGDFAGLYEDPGAGQVAALKGVEALELG